MPQHGSINCATGRNVSRSSRHVPAQHVAFGASPSGPDNASHGPNPEPLINYFQAACPKKAKRVVVEEEFVKLRGQTHPITDYPWPFHRTQVPE